MPLIEYTFLRVVGKGSYGEVSLVRHRHDGKQYVIKRLNLKHASSRERKAAEQEAQLLSQLKHPNIVTYRESWEGDNGLLYIVMGFCEGGDLYHKLKEQKGQLLPESQVVEWLVQIAMALQYLHEKHILHRDLKTQNVFLTRSNIIKVGDLGIARVLDNQHDMASTLIGTPYYMSPELFSNKPYNYKSDVWALGCCAYEMATLKHAFNAKDMNSLVYRIIEGKLPPMPKDYSTQLKELIRTMLSKKPEERPSVRNILRQPYIKQQISLFLEATKAKTSKNHKKVSEPKPWESSEKTELKKETTEPQKLPNELSKKSNGNEDKCLINNKTFEVSSSKKLAPEPEDNSKNGLNSLDASLATMSKVDILIVSLEKKNSATKQLAEHKESENVHIPNEAEPEKAKNGLELEEENLLKMSKTCPKTGVVDAKETDNGDDTTNVLQPISKISCVSNKNLDCTEKLLVPIDPREILSEASCENSGEAKDPILPISTPCFRPQGSVQEPSLSRQRRHKKQEQFEICLDKIAALGARQLPALPAVKTKEVNIDHQCAAIVLKKSKSFEVEHSKDRPLSARERRRLKQCQEDMLPSGNTCFCCEVLGALKSYRVYCFLLYLLLKDRPLSARERRRLKQCQEDMLPSGPSVRRMSYNASTETKLAKEDSSIQIAQFTSEPSTDKKKSLIGCCTEDELSSSTSSTEKSDGDCKERKSNEMNDLLQLMTQTLKMDNIENYSQFAMPTPDSQFRLNRKYRDTLILHGKAAEEPDKFQLQELPSDVKSGPQNIRRLVEILRADVVQGIGIKLLEKVYYAMEEEDEQKRELCLRKLMGEKYTSYSMKARHLKFLEDNVKL
ncbi:PREDICTED: serine/threonine-protein kinase Nek4 [Thamnophis sirtalis]|uniref:Serine/threonine-protein kinase Nek4 n=1 Tax=Thamnophis sirtalis TaxID=35019 RepID=A0A6I9YKJ3_9SAUR|nr:PREDICTED: serine/threonine-protein kinase Nek4 [Thamnophis sirtalis]